MMGKAEKMRKSVFGTVLFAALCAMLVLALTFGGGIAAVRAEASAITLQVWKEGYAISSNISTTVLENINFNKVTSNDTGVAYTVFLRRDLNNPNADDGKFDITSITGTGEDGNIAGCGGAVQFYVYLETKQTPSAVRLWLKHNDEDEWQDVRAKITWDVASVLQTNAIIKFTLPLAKATFVDGGWTSGLANMLKGVGGFGFAADGVKGDLYVSAVNVIPSTATEIDAEVIPFGAPTLSVEGMAKRAVIEEEIHLKPLLVLPAVYTQNSMKYKVEKANGDNTFTPVGAEVTVESDDDYAYTFTEAGTYRFTYTLNATLQDGDPANYTAENTVTVIGRDTITLTPSVLPADAVDITLADIPMHMVRNTMGNCGITEDLRQNGQTVDISGITGDTTQDKPTGALELYVYYAGTNPQSVEFRLDREQEDDWSTFRFHQSWTPAVQSGKLMKYTLPLRAGVFATGATAESIEDATEKLYKIIGGFAVMLVNGQGMLLVSDVKVVPTAVTAEIKTEEVSITEPVIVAENLLPMFVVEEEANFEPIVIKPSNMTSATLSVAVAGPDEKTEFTPQNAADWKLSFAEAGDYTVTYKLQDGDKTCSKSTDFKVVAYQEREINKGIGFYDEQSLDDGGARVFDGITYRYITKSETSETPMRYVWFRTKNVHGNSSGNVGITDMPLEACVLELYMYVHCSGEILDSEVRLGNCTDSNWDAGWTCKCWSIKSIPKDKLVKLTLRLSDATIKQPDAQTVWDAINSMYIYVAGNNLQAGDYMLVSDFRVVTTSKATAIEVVDENFAHDLTPPNVSAPVCEGGKYDRTYDLMPTISKESYEGILRVQVQIAYGDNNVLRTFTYEGVGGGTLNSQMEADLKAFAFPTGRTYTITVTAADEYGNSASDSSTVVITGTPPDTTAPVIDVSGVDTAVKRGDIVDLGAIVITDDRDAGSDITVVYRVTFGEQAVTVTGGKFTAEQVGTYTVTVTANDLAGNSASETFTVTAAKKTDTAPTISVPDTFVTKYALNGQVNLSSITATGADGEAATVTFTVKAPNGSAVTVTNNKFVFGDAGEYTVTITAVDADGNRATKDIKITAEKPAEEKKGCKSSITANTMGAAVLSLSACFVAVLLLRRKKERL